ncbi:MAG: hypothetical protein WC492_04950, partial [Candidatus Micrarchaeia archaeon]
LQHNQRYNLVSSGDDNYNWKVSLIWKNRDWSSATSSNISDSLREIVLFDEDTISSKKMIAGDVYNFPKKSTAFRLTFNGLDLTDADYAQLGIESGSSTDSYSVSNATNSADCTDSGNKMSYTAKLIKFKSDGNNFGGGGSSDLMSNYRLGEFYYDPVGGKANVTTAYIGGAQGNFSISHATDRYNGTQAYNYPREYVNVTVTGWEPAILYRPSGFTCFLNTSVGLSGTAVTGAAKSKSGTQTVSFDPAGTDSSAPGLLYFSNITTTSGPSGVNGTIYFQEDAGKNDTTSHPPVFVQIPFINSTSDWRFKGTESSTSTVYYHGIRDAASAWQAYEPTVITERGTKITSVGTTSMDMYVAKKIGQPTFTFASEGSNLISKCNSTDVCASTISASIWNKYSPSTISKIQPINHWFLVQINLTNGSQTFAQSLSLSQGWNLISFTITPENPSLASIFSSIYSNVDSVWYYENNEWQNYVPEIGGTLTTIQPGKAYFVKAKEPALLTVYGTYQTSNQDGLMGVPPFSINVYPGWNLLGAYISWQTTGFPTPKINTITGNYMYSAIYTHDSLTKKVSPVDGEMQIPIGSGFWLYTPINGSYSPRT